MPTISKWMVAYGLLLVFVELLDVYGILPIGMRGTTLVSGWGGGLLMIAAALCSAQGRRSVRLTGLYVGTLLPLGLAGIFTWHAAALWRNLAPNASMIPPMGLSVLSLITLALLAILAKLWPREGIASRGYAIPIPPPAKPKPHHAEEKPRRSEAG